MYSPNIRRLFYIDYEQSLHFGEVRRTSKEKSVKKNNNNNSLAYRAERWEWGAEKSSNNLGMRLRRRHSPFSAHKAVSLFLL